jgi:hypothetical protein
MHRAGHPARSEKAARRAPFTHDALSDDRTRFNGTGRVDPYSGLDQRSGPHDDLVTQDRLLLDDRAALQGRASTEDGPRDPCVMTDVRPVQQDAARDMRVVADRHVGPDRGV